MGEKSEYSENVPSDLDFLGGCFSLSETALQMVLDGSVSFKAAISVTPRCPTTRCACSVFQIE